MMAEITILTVNWDNSGLIRELFANLLGKAACPDELKMIVIDNTNGSDTAISEIARGDGKTQLAVHKLDSAGYKGSRGHAFALNYARRFLETEYTLLVDPDVYVFKSRWDAFCVDLLKKNQCFAAGAPYPPWKVGRYRNFPSPPFCFFRTQALENMESDWTPFSDSRFADAYIFFVRQLGRMAGLLNRKRMEKSLMLRSAARRMESIFGVFSRDTGWRIAEETRRKKMESVLFSTAWPGQIELAQGGDVKAFQELAGQYELYYYENEPILTHKYSTAGRAWRTKRGRDTLYWRECIKQFEKGGETEAI